jgi:hypothetical protein
MWDARPTPHCDPLRRSLLRASPHQALPHRVCRAVPCVGFAPLRRSLLRASPHRAVPHRVRSAAPCRASHVDPLRRSLTCSPRLAAPAPAAPRRARRPPSAASAARLAARYPFILPDFDIVVMAGLMLSWNGGAAVPQAVQCASNSPCGNDVPECGSVARQARQPSSSDRDLSCREVFVARLQLTKRESWRVVVRMWAKTYQDSDFAHWNWPSRAVTPTNPHRWSCDPSRSGHLAFVAPLGDAGQPSI